MFCISTLQAMEAPKPAQSPSLQTDNWHQHHASGITKLICHDQAVSCATVGFQPRRRGWGWLGRQKAAYLHGHASMTIAQSQLYLTAAWSRNWANSSQACDICRARKTRCDEDRPRCGYCRNMNLDCTYQEPRPTKYVSIFIQQGNNILPLALMEHLISYLFNA